MREERPEEEYNIFERAIRKTGCWNEHLECAECINLTKDWRECKEEVIASFSFITVIRADIFLFIEFVILFQISQFYGTILFNFIFTSTSLYIDSCRSITRTSNYSTTSNDCIFKQFIKRYLLLCVNGNAYLYLLSVAVGN